MIVISKEEFVAWATSPLTKRIQKALKERMVDQRVLLSRGIKGMSIETLKYNAGYMDGVEDTLEFDKLFDFEIKEED